MVTQADNEKLPPNPLNVGPPALWKPAERTTHQRIITCRSAKSGGILSLLSAREGVRSTLYRDLGLVAAGLARYGVHGSAPSVLAGDIPPAPDPGRSHPKLAQERAGTRNETGTARLNLRPVTTSTYITAPVSPGSIVHDRPPLVTPPNHITLFQNNPHTTIDHKPTILL
ncbi:hypothetical protein DHEL01_v208424 [Diaporthe helianthi]|uniref:Uncharacterized protein n=1 Tax=Diaporthe helianthi TaxID=158607 RepID=A0A2P5HSG4_DIAHE|nr:hypothetical protein DHEL01_v208424 [Diaporthe helianthi]